MSTVPPVTWKKMDPIELHQKLLGYGDLKPVQESKSKVSFGRSLFSSRKRTSTAPGSTLPRIPFNPLLHPTSNPPTSHLDLTHSHSEPLFPRKRLLRRSRSVNGLLGMMASDSERALGIGDGEERDWKIKRKAVPRLSNPGVLAVEPVPTSFDPFDRVVLDKEPRRTSDQGVENDQYLTPSPEYLLGTNYFPIQPHTPLNHPQTVQPTTYSPQPNPGLVASHSLDSLASQSLETPDKNKTPLTLESPGSPTPSLRTGIDRKVVANGGRKRFGTIGWDGRLGGGEADELDHHHHRGHDHDHEHDYEDEDEHELSNGSASLVPIDLHHPTHPTILNQGKKPELFFPMKDLTRMGSREGFAPIFHPGDRVREDGGVNDDRVSKVETDKDEMDDKDKELGVMVEDENDDDDDENMEDRSSETGNRRRSDTVRPSAQQRAIIAQSIASVPPISVSGSANTTPMNSPPRRPPRPPGLVLDLSTLKPFAFHIPASFTENAEIESLVSSGGSVEKSLEDGDSSYQGQGTATTEESFCALRKDSLDSDFSRPAVPGLRGAFVLGQSGLNQMFLRGDLADGEKDRREEEEERLNEGDGFGLDVTPKQEIRLDPFDINAVERRRNSVIAWTAGLRSELGTPADDRSEMSNSTVLPLPRRASETMFAFEPPSPTSMPDPDKEMEEELATRRPGRGNRRFSTADDGRVSRGGYWDYSIIKGGGIATPPPPEFFSTFQAQSPGSPERKVGRSPGRSLPPSPLQNRVDSGRNHEIGPTPPIPSNYAFPNLLSPERINEKPSAEKISTPQRMLKYGMNVLSSPRSLLSPKQRQPSNFTREESDGLLAEAGNMGEAETEYSESSHYDEDRSGAFGLEGVSVFSIGEPLSPPRKGIRMKDSPQLVQLERVRWDSGNGSRASPGPSLRTIDNRSMAASTSAVDSLALLEIDMLPEDYPGPYPAENIARFNNAPPVFHFPSPPPSDRHHSISSMLSGTSGLGFSPRQSSGAFLADQMNHARKEQQQDLLSVLNPLPRKSTSTQGDKVHSLTPSGSAPLTPDAFRALDTQLNPLLIINGPSGVLTPPTKSTGTFSQDHMTPPRMTQSSTYGSPIHTPKKLTSAAAIAAHGPGISIISPNRNFPRMRTAVPHDSPQRLPTAGSRRDILFSAERPSLDDDTDRSHLMKTSSSQSSLAHTAHTYRDDIRLRPLQQLTEDKIESANSKQSFGLSSQQSDNGFGEELSEHFATRGRWEDVYCACFGKRIC